MWWASRHVPSGFSSPYVSGVCCSASVPSRVSVLHSPLELSIMPTANSDFFHLQLLSATRHGRPLPSVVEGLHLENILYYPIQWVESKDGTTWELIWGLGYSGSSLPPGGSLSSTNLLYREDFLRSVRSRLGLSSDEVVSGAPTAWRC